MSDVTPIRKGIITDQRRTELISLLKESYQKRLDGINAWRAAQWAAKLEVGEEAMHELLHMARENCGVLMDAPGPSLEVVCEPRIVYE